MIDETLNYRYDEQKQDDNNIGVIHIYRKNDNAWVGFIRYIKQDENNKPFVKFYPSDLGGSISLEEQFKYELSYYSKKMAEDWKINDGVEMNVKSDLEVKFHMIIDKGDGTPPREVDV